MKLRYLALVPTGLNQTHVRLATVEVLAVAFILKRGANAFPAGFTVFGKICLAIFGVTVIWQDLFIYVPRSKLKPFRRRHKQSLQ